jgi:hypothetical protein
VDQDDGGSGSRTPRWAIDIEQQRLAIRDAVDDIDLFFDASARQGCEAPAVSS